MRIMRINFQQFINKRAIVDHGLPQFFRAGFSPLLSPGKRAGDAVILNDDWMVHRQVSGATIEVFQGVAARGHHLGYELVGFADRAVRVVDEARLDATPFTAKRADLFLSELVQVETADALSALAQDRVCTFGADSLNGSIVLRAKLFAQVDPLAPAGVRPRRKREQQHDNPGCDHHEGL